MYTKWELHFPRYVTALIVKYFTFFLAAASFICLLWSAILLLWWSTERSTSSAWRSYASQPVGGAELKLCPYHIIKHLHTAYGREPTTSHKLAWNMFFFLLLYIIYKVLFSTEFTTTCINIFVMWLSAALIVCSCCYFTFVFLYN